MDVAALKTLIPLAITIIGAVIALAKMQAKVAESSKQLDMLAKDVSRLESEQAHTTTLMAKMDQVERNITQLWGANDSHLQKMDAMERNMTGKLERHRDRLDERFIALREKINGGHK